jgi:hypothetical protein
MCEGGKRKIYRKERIKGKRRKCVKGKEKEHIKGKGNYA